MHGEEGGRRARDCSIVTVSCTECQRFREVVWECPVGRHGNTFCPRRAAKNGNYNTFCPRRAAKGRGERQRQHLLSTKGREERQLQLPLVHGGPRRAAKNGNCYFLLSTEGREGPRRTATATPFVHGGPLGAAENFLLIHGVRGVSGEESGRERTLGPSQSGGAGTVAGALRFLVAG